MRIVVLPPRGVAFHEQSPWRSLLVGLRQVGHEVGDFGEIAETADALVTLNDQPEARQLQSRYRIPASRSALVVLEPQVTAPGMYRQRVLQHYQLRYAPSPLWAKRLGYAGVFPWPQTITRPSIAVPESDYAATMINGEKRSAVRGSLYGLRREIVRSCDSEGVPLAVFGPGWGDSTTTRLQEGGKAIARAIKAGQHPWVAEAISHPTIRPRHYQGTTPSKACAFGHARAAIVVENSPDYVSEKLIDAICAGVAPIYVGPPLDLFKIPPSVAIECGQDASLVCRTLRGLTESRRAELVFSGRDWLAAEASRAHDITVVLTALGHRIGAQLGR